jgi:dolichol-phosphate mannosyltransferase
MTETPARLDSDSLLVTLCTYNERENLAALAQEIHAFAPDADVLVIDDNSPDGTGRLADELAAADARTHVLHRPGKLGLGTATVAGFRWAIGRGYGWLVNMDADFSHHPRYLPALRAAAAQADVAIGSRYVPGGGVEGWGPLRHVMSRGVNWYARLLLRLPTRDNSGSFRCYRVSKLAEIDLGRVRSKGYAFEEEILYRCRRVGCRFREVPIVFADRRHGQSKINTREVGRALWDILNLGVESARGAPVRPDHVERST